MNDIIDALPADAEAAQQALRHAGLTDGLPVIVPTRGRVQRMLEANGRAPDALVAVLPPLYGEATWRALAINAVMAGCRDDALPVVAAAVAAVADDAFNLLGIATTTGSATPLVIVSGPAAARAGMHWEANALGPGNHANPAIGRALHLVIQNVGGARPGEVDMSTLGQPGKFTFCCAENAAGTPWPPLHVQRGLRADESAVMVVGAAGIVEIVDSESRSAEELAATFGASTLIAGSVGSAGLLGGGEPLFVMPPEHAQLFHDAGWTLAQVREAIWTHAWLPVDRLSPAAREKLAYRREMSGTDDGNVVRASAKPEDIMIVVTGGVGRKGAYVPTWGGGTRAVTRPIR